MDGYLTQKGARLIAKLNALQEKLTITSIWGGNGTQPSEPYADMTDISAHDIKFSTYNMLAYENDGKLTFTLYFDNKNLASPYSLTEIGVFAHDPDEGDILLCVIPMYDSAQNIPAHSAADNGNRFELTSKVTIELQLAPTLEIIISDSLIFLTIEEALRRFWVIGKKYPATEITESTGTTTEEWQRIQDERIKQLEVTLESGTTAGITANKPPSDWKILNNSGYRDRERGTIRAW